MKKLLILMMTVIAAVAMLTTGCGGSDKQDNAKVFRVGTEPTFAPFEFQEEGSKEYSGFDMDLARAVGKQLGYEKVEIVNMGFDALVPALNAGNVDMVAAGMSITPERQKAVNFSDPYYTSGLIIMVNQDNNVVKSVKDLEGKRIACQIGTTGDKKARSIANAEVVSFNTNTEAAMELTNKGVDAVINDSPVVGFYLAQGGNKTAKTVGEVMEAEKYGLAMKKGNDQLTADVNKALAELKKNGEYDKIYQKWFGEVSK